MNPISWFWDKTLGRVRSFVRDAQSDVAERRLQIWDAAEEWEHQYTFDWDHADAECPQQPERMEEAQSLAKARDPKSLDLYKRAADDGSLWSMWMVGWHYEVGLHVETDLAEAAEWYRKAMKLGSMRATLAYAKVLREQAGREQAIEALQEAVKREYLPAVFWEAYYRYSADPTKKTARIIRPQLNAAADAGHPFARFTRSRLMARGRYEIACIWPGLRDLLAINRELADASRAA